MPYRKRPKTSQEKQKLADLILQNVSEFPMKVRPFIATARIEAEDFPERNILSETKAGFFLIRFGEAVEKFFFGLPIPRDLLFLPPLDPSVLDSGWHGPDSAVDTLEQLELAIRVFPAILKTKYNLDLNDIVWTNLPPFFLTSAKAVSFLPMLADLYTEYGRSHEFELVQISCELLDNTCLKMRYKKEPTNELHEASLAAFLRLREKGYLDGDDGKILDILEVFIARAIEEKSSYKSTSFIVNRLQHLIEWEPDVVVVDRVSINSCLIAHLHRSMQLLDHQLYEFILEQGMLYWPRYVMGFGFHRLNFEASCAIFGRNEVNQVMNKKIKDAVVRSKKKNAIQEWVLKAAIDDMISLDGLYTLVRFDPSAVMNITKTTVDSLDLSDLKFSQYCR
eukprot:CAMPEP_0116118560 /NCGR_PEP_ID=MMETSP0329-20121206/2168_1 /TAXON_ID=697910 /ORGANISM="Pseudo-nitzschia arenysensis, Strain B593" /LENGTH=392 /DNA_ID=CAMNT_0003612193 /DNA_START=406 /DNA_END=1584 /DNA_ORIENTATION=-